ncbi:MAG: cyclic nucleotide-binding domain-containing protein [Solirubrobacterales bacterium]
MDVSQLKKIPLFDGVGDDALNQVATFATAEVYPPEGVVVKEGGFANHLYAIEEGTARVEQGGELLAELGPGDYFGERGLLTKDERSASVIATSELRLIKIEHWELSRMKKAMPEVVERLRQRADSFEE